MSDYTITLPDGTVVEAPTMYECVQMYWGITDGKEPVATLGEQEYTLSDFAECYERKSISDNYTTTERAVYTDVAEKLRTLDKNGALGESP